MRLKPKAYLLLLLLTCLLGIGTSQPAWAEAGLFQGSERLTAFAVAVEGDYVYIAGEATNLALPPGSLDLGGGMKDIYLAKLRTDGTLVYSAQIGGRDMDSAYALAVRQGVVYLLGETWSHDFPGAPGNAGESDAVLLALAADGSQVLWARRFGGSGQEAGRALAIHAGSLYMTGVTWSEDLVPSGGTGLGDGFVARLELDGRLTWLQVFGGRTLDVPFDLAVGDSGVWIAGQSFSTDFGGVQQGGGDAFVTRFSLAGTQQFANLYGGRSEDMAYGITLAGDGGVYLVGGTQSGGLTPAFGTFGGSFDGFMMRIEPDGALRSTSYLGGSSADYAHDVLSLPNGGALVVGVTYSQTFPLGYPRSASSTSRSNAFVVHLQPTGDLADAWLFGGTGDDQALAAVLTPQGLWLAGRFSTGPLGFALLVPPSDIPGVPLPGITQPLPTATLALTATPQPTETPRLTATALPTATLPAVPPALTATALTAEAAYPAEEALITPATSTEAIDPDQALAVTRTAEVALTQGLPLDHAPGDAASPPVTAAVRRAWERVRPAFRRDNEASGLPVGLVVGGGLLLAAGFAGAVIAIHRKHKPGELEASIKEAEIPVQAEPELLQRDQRKGRRADKKPSDEDLLL